MLIRSIRSDRSGEDSTHHAAWAFCAEGYRCLTRNNIAVLVMLAGLGLYLHQASQPSGETLGYYLVALYGTDAEKQSLINDVAREQAETLHLRVPAVPLVWNAALTASAEEHAMVASSPSD